MSHINTQTEHQPSVEMTPVEIKKLLNQLKALLTTDDGTVNDLFFKSEKILKQFFGTVIEQLGEQITVCFFQNKDKEVN